MSRSSLFMVAGALTFALSAPAIAKVYYIDNVSGNDTWPGTASSPVSGNGPWRSFTHLAVANKLLPGDSVLLRCGGKWSETLRLNSSGTAAAPIRIGSYPDSCTNKPAIDGAQAIPATAWMPHSGNIYKTKLGTAEGSSLIANGALTSSFSGWRLWSASNNAKAGITSSCPDSSTGCLAFTGGSSGNSFVSSSAFPIQSAARYRVTFSIRAPAGGRYGAYVRRSTSPWDTLGLAAASFTGTGAWQTVTLPFTASSNVSNARLDLQLYQPLAVHIKNVRVAPETAVSTAAPLLVVDNNVMQSRAHHPNRGHNKAAPDSPYLLTSSGSATVTGPDGRPGSRYVVTGSDLVLPAGATLQPGLRATVRSQAWTVSEHTVSSISGNQIHLDSITPYPLQRAGWGYYLTGALWMLDSPGEWHYDTATQTLYVWPRRSGTPGEGFRYSALGLGMDINRKQHIHVDGIAMRNMRDGIYSQRAQGVTLRGIEISNMTRYGIDGEGMVGLELADSQLHRTGSSVIYTPTATASIIRNNDISHSGLELNDQGKPINLPVANSGAIRTGPAARISGNRLKNMAFIGIAAGTGSEVSDNAITGFCYLFNDCSGIYIPFATSGLVSGNLVRGGVGDRLGMPAIYNTSLASNLYLDMDSSGVTASDNVLIGGDFAVQIHDGHSNRIERNVMYGGRGSLLWLQESSNDKRTAGNIYGNTIAENSFFPINLQPSVNQSAKVEDTSDFGVYYDNVYSSLISPVMAVESTAAGSRDYQLPDWQSATYSYGGARNLDTNGKVGAPLDGFARGLLGSTLVSNGDLAGGATGWTPYSAALPTAKIAVENCTPFTSRCLRLTAGGGNSLVSTPRFNVSKGQWYRVSFDAQTGVAGQPFRVKAIESGPTSYAGVMNTGHFVFSGSTTLKRYSLVFQATATVQRSSTSAGARVDFMDVKPGQFIRVANFEIVPLTLTPGGVSHTVFSNAERGSINVACPSEQTAPALCSNYYLFPQGSKAVWPLTLAPLTAQVVFSQDAVHPDSDKDTVADSQDLCPGTATGTAANAKGCGLGQ